MFNTIVFKSYKLNIMKLIKSFYFFLKVFEECAIESCSVSTFFFLTSAFTFSHCSFSFLYMCFFVLLDFHTG